MDTDKVIVALDTIDLNKTDKILQSLKGMISVFKIGMQSFTRYGVDIVKRVQDSGYKVFLDLKFFDIPNTVEKAVFSAIENEIYMLTLHIMGGKEMIKRAKEVKEEKKTPFLLGVTVLTSMDESNLKDIGIEKPIDAYVPFLASYGKLAGLDGVISSPHEIKSIRKTCGDNFLIVTPGIRKEKVQDDQKRVLTPKRLWNLGQII
ncbi:MAG: orotidine-5'-phosphate decarboxylase [Proteobacteria bacterium]|nr:orotidine-5'-phosphate decarboxylase [Pseudomonadota bacterium]